MHKNICLILFAFLLFCLPAHADEPVIGQPAPALIVNQFDGHTFDLSRQRGHVVIVNFWATWCAPCRAEMPVLDDAYRRYHAEGLEMIGVSADNPRHRDDASGLMEKFGYPGAMMSDAEVNDFGKPVSLPVTYVIGADGVVKAKLTPDDEPVTGESLGKALGPLLKK